ncbi:hypothetical protein QBC46DRAFT_371264 [Diplogelasinospora grovesii]|uniref:Uncharacterized protein n=1 Tax=Diplogelasinospora grovesii TaxID=303347 RepID=A0AAN6NIA2_9PEZI|nr:hypothetical protein QBC46DRAFT_371264 [Diplogelasinospora grovesii]
MDDLSRMSDVDGDLDTVVVTDDDGKSEVISSRGGGFRSPLTKTRSLSDGGGTPGKLSPSPHIFDASQRQSKDDIAIRDKEHSSGNRYVPANNPPSTPIRTGFQTRGLSLHMPQPALGEPTSPAAHQQPAYVKPAPLSPKLDHSHIYASPTNILPRRSRGLDFSRAATSLHHSTLADNQTSPDSSPTIGSSRAVNIPGSGRRYGEYGSHAEMSSNSLWSMMGNQERMHISSSVGSNTHMHMLSDSSSSSDEDDFMDDADMEDAAFVTTPQVAKVSTPSASGAPWMPAPPGMSPAVNSLKSFQQRQRQRKQSKMKMRLPLGGFSSSAAGKSPPNNGMAMPKDIPNPHSRRESISWAANQLHISGSESDENMNRHLEGGVDSPSRPGVIRRAVTRRGNLLPKTKGFARIRAALAEESAPVESEFQREAEVIRQVRESDMVDHLDLRPPATHSTTTTALSSPSLATQADTNLDEISEADAMIMDSPANPLGLTGGSGSGSFKHQALKNGKGKVFWDTFPDGPQPRITPPPPSFGLARGSSSGLSMDDLNMDSPSAGSATQNNPFVLPTQTTTASSSGHDTPQPTASSGQSGSGSGAMAIPNVPSAAEITRRINSKRRRDDDFDPVSFKRRAVSPGMSVHNSPIMQSPLQRDMGPWGGSASAAGGHGGSRPGSVGCDTINTRGTPSEAGSNNGGGSGSGSKMGVNGGKGRVGYQGMVDTNDGITRLSIE